MFLCASEYYLILCSTINNYRVFANFCSQIITIERIGRQIAREDHKRIQVEADQTRIERELMEDELKREKRMEKKLT